MITSNISNTGLKKLYSFFVITGLFLLFTTFLVPQKAGAQAFVPVKDAELISAFKLFLESTVGSAGGGTYFVDGNPVEIAAEVCETRTQGVTSENKKAFFRLDINGNGIIDLEEEGVYKQQWKFTDLNGNGISDGPHEWTLKNIAQFGDIYYTRTNIDRATENPGDPTYYDNPANLYFFLPNKNELTPAEVNNSISLNCLLQELVEWEKLQINMQMHSMVKEYFTDAQTYMLSQQLLSTLAAATIEWSNKELEQKIYIDGVATTTKGAIYPDNIYEEGQGVMSKETAGMGGQITGAANVVDLEVNPLDEVYLKEQLEKNTKSSVESRDASDTTLKNAVKYPAPPAGNSAEDAYIHAMRNSALNISGVLESAVGGRMTQAADNQKAQWEAYGGYLSVLDCGEPGVDPWYDPYCRTPRLETPGNMLGQNLYQASQSGIEALKVADELGESTGASTQELTYQLQQQSLRDYEIQQLLNNQQTPQELFDEFEFVLTDYYGIASSTTHWSRNMLVNTWDDIMWGSGAPGKATDLGRRLDEIILEVEKYGTP